MGKIKCSYNFLKLKPEETYHFRNTCGNMGTPHIHKNRLSSQQLFLSSLSLSLLLAPNQAAICSSKTAYPWKISTQQSIVIHQTTPTNSAG